MSTTRFNNISLRAYFIDAADSDQASAHPRETTTEFKKLSVDNKILSLSQLMPLYWNADHIDTAINNYILDKTDVGYHTFLRLWQVFENVELNHTNSDADRTDSSFNHDIHAHSEIALFSIIPA